MGENRQSLLEKGKMGGEIDIQYFAIMNTAVVVQKVVGIIINPKQ